MKQERRDHLQDAAKEESGRSCSDAKRRGAAFAIFVLALLLRLLYLCGSTGNPTFFAPIMDSNYYDRSLRTRRP
jgi:hypothetical protein